MRSRRRLGFAFGVLLASGVVSLAPGLERRARASLVIALDLPTMVQRSDHVAVVDVGTVSAAWDDRHERILTTIDLAVVESWKGSMTPATHVKVIQPGGTVGDIQMTVFGMSVFTPGERALVFLRGTPASASVVGMAQGKRMVRRDLGTGRWLVHAPDRAGASFVRVPSTPSAPSSTTSSTTSSTPSSTPPVFDSRLRALDDLRAEVRGLVGNANGNSRTLGK